jgi:uncharacterized protein YjbJ (UPF0337 family)
MRRTTKADAKRSQRRAEAKTTETKGRFKKAFGRLTKNRSMEAEGRRDQATGSVRQAGQKVKDAFRK